MSRIAGVVLAAAAIALPRVSAATSSPGGDARPRDRGHGHDRSTPVDGATNPAARALEHYLRYRLPARLPHHGGIPKPLPSPALHDVLTKVIDAAHNAIGAFGVEFPVNRSPILLEPVPFELPHIARALVIEPSDNSTARALLTCDRTGRLKLEIDHDCNMALRVMETEPEPRMPIASHRAEPAANRALRASVLAQLHEQLNIGGRYKLRLKVEAQPGGDISAAGSVTAPAMADVDLSEHIDYAHVLEAEVAHAAGQRELDRFAATFVAMAAHLLGPPDRPER